jgi:GNAT superfamily N-acetyltransferase
VISPIRQAHPGEWRIVRTLRLEALADAPGAFGSTHRQEVALSDEEWIQFLGAFTWFVVDDPDDGPPFGLVAGRLGPEVPAADAEVISMWVAGRRRGDGTADRLLTTVMGWAIGAGAATITLWVSAENDRARRFYERHGFSPTGQREPLRSNPAVMTIEYRRRV